MVMNIFPVEINSAPFIDLIRVPGIGVKSAKKIISIRKKYKFTKKEELKNKITEYKDYLSEQKDIARKSFKCISIEYYNDTGRIKYMEFTEK